MPLEVIHGEKQGQQRAAHTAQAQVDVLDGVVVVLEFAAHGEYGDDLQRQTSQSEQATKWGAMTVSRRGNEPVDESTHEVTANRAQHHEQPLAVGLDFSD